MIAPLTAGKAIGELTVSDAAGTVVATAPLVPFADVPVGGWWTRLVDTIRLWFFHKSA